MRTRLSIIACIVVLMLGVTCYAQEEEEAYQATTKAGKITFPYMDWAYVAAVQREGNNWKVTRDDGSALWTNVPERMGLVGVCVTNGSPLIMNWLSPTSYNAVYTGW